MIARVLWLSLASLGLAGCNKEMGKQKVNHNHNNQTKRNEAFLDAVSDGDINETIELLQNGANIRTTNDEGENALHIALTADYFEIVTLLINHADENNLDINIADQMGFTPLLQLLNRIYDNEPLEHNNYCLRDQNSYNVRCPRCRFDRCCAVININERAKASTLKEKKKSSCIGGARESKQGVSSTKFLHGALREELSKT